MSTLHWIPWQAEVGYTEEEVAQITWGQQDLAKQVVRKYELDALMLVNSFFKVSYAEWMQMPRLVRRAMSHLAEEQSRELESKRREQESKLKQQMAEVSQSVKLPHQPPSALNRLMGT